MAWVNTVQGEELYRGSEVVGIEKCLSRAQLHVMHVFVHSRTLTTEHLNQSLQLQPYNALSLRENYIPYCHAILHSSCKSTQNTLVTPRVVARHPHFLESTHRLTHIIATSTPHRHFAAVGFDGQVFFKSSSSKPLSTSRSILRSGQNPSSIPWEGRLAMFAEEGTLQYSLNNLTIQTQATFTRYDTSQHGIAVQKKDHTVVGANSCCLQQEGAP